MIELDVRGRRLDQCYCNPYLKQPLVTFKGVTGYVLEDSKTVVVMLKGSNNIRFKFGFEAPAKKLMALLFDEDLRSSITTGGRVEDDLTRLLMRKKPLEGI